jgi:multisubunit Na+/H+ antiporter MnhE subunit
MMCELLIGTLIVGALEMTPGTMTVDYINRQHLVNPDHVPQVERIEIPVQQYLDCPIYY